MFIVHLFVCLCYVTVLHFKSLTLRGSKHVFFKLLTKDYLFIFKTRPSSCALPFAFYTLGPLIWIIKVGKSCCRFAPLKSFVLLMWPMVSVKSVLLSTREHSLRYFVRGVSMYGWPPVWLVWIQLLCLCLINNRFTCLVKSKPVKHVSCTAILPPTVKILPFWIKIGK